jgi:hypothetical protein
MAIPLDDVCTGTVATPPATGQHKKATSRHKAAFCVIVLNH